MLSLALSSLIAVGADRATVAVPAVPAPSAAETWQPLGPEGANVISLVASRSDPSRYWALVDNLNTPFGQRRMLRSSFDGGLTWSDDPGVPGSRMGQISRLEDSLMLLTGVNEGFLMRRLDGNNWFSAVQTHSDFAGHEAVLMAPAQVFSSLLVGYAPDYWGMPGGLAVTLDGGESWENVSPPGVGAMTPSAAAMPEGMGQRWAAAFHGDGGERALWFRRQEGEPWVQLDEGLPTGRITTLEWNDTLLFVTVEGAGLFVGDMLEDFHWARADTGFVARGTVNATLHASASPGSLFVATESGLHRTDSAGQDWQHQLPGTTGQRVRAMHASTFSQGRLTLGAYPAGILISTDAGQSFEALSQGLFDRPTLSVSGNPLDPSELLTVVDDQTVTSLMRSRDLGGSWVRMAGAPRNPVRVFHSPQGQAYVLARGARMDRGAGVFFQRADGGWTGAPLPGAASGGAEVTRLVFSEHAPGRLWAVGADRRAPEGRRASVWRSENGGASWVQVWKADNAHSALELMPVTGSADQDLLLVVRRTDFLTTLTRSIDGGATWFDFNEGLEGFATRTQTCAFADTPGTVYAKIGNSSDLGSVYERDLGDPEAVWSPVVNGSYFFERFICDQNNPGSFFAAWSQEQYAGVRRATLGGSWSDLDQWGIEAPSRIDEMVLTPAGLFIASERGVMRLAEPSAVDAPQITTLTSNDTRVQRQVVLQWDAGAEWVEVFRNGEPVAEMPNGGVFSERLLRRGPAVEYQVCNAFSEGCSEPVTLAP